MMLGTQHSISSYALVNGCWLEPRPAHRNVCDLIGSVLGSLQTFAVMADDALSDDGGLLVLLLLSLQPANKLTVITAVKIRHKALFIIFFI